jgi:hypothetical protein
MLLRHVNYKDNLHQPEKTKLKRRFVVPRNQYKKNINTFKQILKICHLTSKYDFVSHSLSEH